MRLAATDTRIPRPLRWLAGLGLLPVPGPFDEAVLLVVAVPLGLFYRRELREAWRRAADPRSPGTGREGPGRGGGSRGDAARGRDHDP